MSFSQKYFRKRLRPLRPFLEKMKLIKPASFGLHGLDRKLLKYVNHKQGVFVEVGANDGRSQSNTAYYEYYLGWSGLLIEPIPELAEKCRINRPHSIVESYALVASDGDAPFEIEMIYCNLMSFVVGARKNKNAELEHLERAKQFLSADDPVRRIRVPTNTLTQLLKKHNFGRIDLLSLDVEGYEANVLRGLDFDQFAPTWILVEANDPDAIDEVLSGRYEFVDQLSHHDKLYKLIP